MRLAIRKRDKHKKYIAKALKKNPMYGFLNLESSQKDAKTNGDSVSPYSKFGKSRMDLKEDMMEFLDEIDQKFSLDDFEESDMLEIMEFIKRRSQMDNSVMITSDGELTRDVAMMLHEHILAGNGQIDDLSSITRGIKKLKYHY